MSDRELPDGYLSGAEVDKFRSPHDGLCWWCGSKGDSREHKFKAPDLKTLLGGTPSGFLYWGSGSTPLNGTNAKSAKFREYNLCRSCNNRRSQPFDQAYEALANYIWLHPEQLQRSDALDMVDVFGTDWQDKVRDVARYYVKHLGCRIREAGFPVPREIIDFLDGADRIQHVHMVLYKDVKYFDQYMQGQGESEDWRGSFIGGISASISKSTGEARRFTSECMTGTIGALFSWDLDAEDADPFYEYRGALLHKRSDLPWEELRIDWPF